MTPAKNHILVIGAGGRLGTTLAASLQRRGKVTALAHRDLDLSSADSIRTTLAPLDFDLVFITAALTGVDYCETHRAEAMDVNGKAPGLIAEIAASKGARAVHIGTDFVFDGAKPTPYTENDPPNPISVYGESKLDGERRVLDADPGNLVARVAWVFGPARPAFPEWIVNQACRNNHVTLPEDKTGSPTYVPDLVEAIETLVFRFPEASGVFHLSNSGSCTWREWGQFCVDVARQRGIPVQATEITGVPLASVEAFVAPRPINSALSIKKFHTITGTTLRPWHEAVREFVSSEAFLHGQPA